MKGIIVAKNSESSVLLLSDGTFKTVKTLEGFEVGMVLMEHLRNITNLLMKTEESYQKSL
jgi:hypothetical protein